MIASALATFARLLSGASVRWAEPPGHMKQRVFFGNHASHLDFVIIWSALAPELRAHTRPVAGADYWNRGAIRRYLAGHVFRAILTERGDSGSAEHAKVAIQGIAAGMGNDCSIIVFPEGTRSLDGQLKPFKSGLYHLCCLKPGLELIPVYLANLHRILPKGEIMPVPLLGRVIFGAPLSLQSGEDKAAFLARARDALLALRPQ
mgnify:CR=1 FL=1